MKAHRTIIFIGGLVLALAAAMPAAAVASSLLSGYGGPGQGNQAILGAALVNGPRGGGGSGSSSGSTTSGTSGAAAPTGSSTSGSGAAGDGRSGSSRHSAWDSARSGRQESTREVSSSAQSFYPASERIASGEQSGTLGLSSADLLYIVLALGLLGFIGVLTRRLARTNAAGRPR
jgi:hypothetical protein